MNIVAHNMLAMNANRMLGITEKKRTKSTEKLSSGYKVNRAADDAAGLAISEKMRRQIRGLTRASANVQDGISYVQTAEGALGEIHDMLHRLTELSIQSANGTNSQTDREYLDAEVQQIKDEIDRTFKETSFNERKIWQGGVLTSYEETYYVSEPAVTFQSKSTNFTITETNKAAIPNTSSFKLTANDDGIKVSWTGYNGKKYESAVVPWSDELAGSHSFELKDYIDTTANPELTGVNATFSYKVHEKASKSDVITAINNKTITCYPNTSEYTETFSSSKISDISFVTSLNYRTLLQSEKDFDAADDLFVEGTNSNNNITITDLSDENNWDKPINFTFDFDNIGSAHTTISSINYVGNKSNPESEGFWKYRAYKNDPYYFQDLYQFSMTPSNGSINSIINALTGPGGKNLITDSSYGGRITFNYNIVADTPFISSDGQTVSNLGTITMYIDVDANDTKDDVINNLSKLTGLDLYDNAAKSNTYGSSPSGDSSNKLSIEKQRTVYVYENQVDIPIQAGFEDEDVIHIDYDCLDIKVLGLESTNVKTIDDSLQAIEDINNAMEVVSRQRSDFGAYQNRLEHTVNNLNNIVENTQAAESQIRDSDMAEEMVKYSNNNIIAQAGTAILSQANQMQNNILSLLQ